MGIPTKVSITRLRSLYARATWQPLYWLAETVSSYTYYWKVSVSFKILFDRIWGSQCLLNVKVVDWPPTNSPGLWACWNVGLHSQCLWCQSKWVNQSMESFSDVWLSYPAPSWWSTTSNHAKRGPISCGAGPTSSLREGDYSTKWVRECCWR